MRNEKGQFIKGNQINLGSKHSEEAKKKMSLFHTGKKLSKEHRYKLSKAYAIRLANGEKIGFKKGCKTWNKGISCPEDVKEKIRKANKGRHYSSATEFKKGVKFSEETKKKISEALKGKKISEETREKIRQANLGKKRPEISGENSPSKRPEVKEKLRLANIGDKNPAWLGGLTFNPYGKKFNKELKLQIKKRDNYICQECNTKKELCIHHIDYNKQNNKKNNLITLCRSCHTKTNFKRDNWTNYFKQKLWQH